MDFRKAFCSDIYLHSKRLNDSRSALRTVHTKVTNQSKLWSFKASKTERNGL